MVPSGVVRHKLMDGQGTHFLFNSYNNNNRFFFVHANMVVHLPAKHIAACCCYSAQGRLARRQPIGFEGGELTWDKMAVPYRESQQNTIRYIAFQRNGNTVMALKRQMSFIKHFSCEVLCVNLRITTDPHPPPGTSTDTLAGITGGERCDRPRPAGGMRTWRCSRLRLWLLKISSRYGDTRVLKGIPMKRIFTDLIFLGFDGRGDAGQILDDFLGVLSFPCSRFPAVGTQGGHRRQWT